MAKKRYHFIAGLTRDKKDFNENCLKSVFEKVKESILEKEDREDFVSETEWEFFFSHMCDAQIINLANTIFSAYKMDYEIHYYYCDIPYFQYSDDMYDKEKTFIKEIYIKPGGELKNGNDINYAYNTSKKLLDNTKMYLNIGDKKVNYPYIKDAIERKVKKVKKYGILLLSTFLYFLFLKINGIEKKLEEFENSLYPLPEKEEKILNALAKKEKCGILKFKILKPKKLKIYIADRSSNSKEQMSKRLKYALEFSSNPNAIEIVDSEDKSHIVISTEKLTNNRPNEGVVSLNFYRYIAWPTEFFKKKLLSFLENGDGYEDIIITIGGIEHNLPMLFWINEMRKNIGDISKAPELDQENFFDYLIKNIAKNKSMILGDSQGLITTLNASLKERDEPFCLFSKLPWKIDEERGHKINIYHIAGLSAFFTKVFSFVYLLYEAGADFLNKEIKGNPFIKDEEFYSMELGMESFRRLNKAERGKKGKEMMNKFDEEDLFNSHNKEVWKDFWSNYIKGIYEVERVEMP